jgi:hypothetical protein
MFSKRQHAHDPYQPTRSTSTILTDDKPTSRYKFGFDERIGDIVTVAQVLRRCDSRQIL